MLDEYLPWLIGFAVVVLLFLIWYVMSAEATPDFSEEAAADPAVMAALQETFRLTTDSTAMAADALKQAKEAWDNTAIVERGIAQIQGILPSLTTAYENIGNQVQTTLSQLSGVITQAEKISARVMSQLTDLANGSIAQVQTSIKQAEVLVQTTVATGSMALQRVNGLMAKSTAMVDEGLQMAISFAPQVNEVATKVSTGIATAAEVANKAEAAAKSVSDTIIAASAELQTKAERVAPVVTTFANEASSALSKLNPLVETASSQANIILDQAGKAFVNSQAMFNDVTPFINNTTGRITTAMNDITSQVQPAAAEINRLIVAVIGASRSLNQTTRDMFSPIVYMLQQAAVPVDAILGSISGFTGSPRDGFVGSPRLCEAIADRMATIQQLSDCGQVDTEGYRIVEQQLLHLLGLSQQYRHGCYRHPAIDDGRNV